MQSCSSQSSPADTNANHNADENCNNYSDEWNTDENGADFLFGLNEETYCDSHDTGAPEDQSDEDYVFPGCDLSVRMSCVLIITFVLHHKLSMKAAQDLIELITAYLPNGHKGVTSFYQLKSYMKNKGAVSYASKASVCSQCQLLLPKDTQSCPNGTCQDLGSEPNEFLVFDVQASLTKLFEGFNLLTTMVCGFFCSTLHLLFR